MLCLPNELLSLIFTYIPNKQDLLQCQLVSHTFLEPARRTFYKVITIQELRDYRHWNENRSYKLKKFIHTMAQCHEGNSRIPPPGPFVQVLHIDFEIPLESDFMPTMAEFQRLAVACPNIEELQFPGNMFWNNILSIDTSRYWKKVKVISHTMNETNVQKFLHFRSSLTYLPIHGWQQPRHQRLSDIVQRFTRLETLQLMNRSFYINHLYDVIPTLMQHPRISGLIMTSSGSPTEHYPHWNVPTLRYLNLTLLEDSPYLTIHNIKEIFTYLNRLVLCFTPYTENYIESDDTLFRAMTTLIRFTVDFLSQAELRLFIHNYKAIHHIAKYFFTYSLTKPSLFVSYNNCSASLTGQPGISYQKDDSTQQVYLRYQSYSDSDILPHLEFLKYYGQLMHHVSIQGPTASLQKPVHHLDTMLTEYCPQLNILNLSRYCFHLASLSSSSSPLFHLTLDRSLITADSLYHASRLCPSLKYLTLNGCFTETEERIQFIRMPMTRFKKLVVIEDRPTSKPYLISIQSSSCTHFYHYCNDTQQVSKIPNTSIADLESNQGTTALLRIECDSMDEFIFNSTPIDTTSV